MNDEMTELLQQYDGYELVTYDGLDHCIVGITETKCGNPTVCYDYQQMLAHFAEEMGYEGAQEWISYNVADLYAGPGTPTILYRPEAP